MITVLRGLVKNNKTGEVQGEWEATQWLGGTKYKVTISLNYLDPQNFLFYVSINSAKILFAALK